MMKSRGIRTVIITILISYTVGLLAYDASDVSFEDSLGSNDHYFQSYFNELKKRLDHPTDKWFSFLGPYAGKDSLQLFKELYTSYPSDDHCRKDRPCIPKIIHQIWIGPRPFPERYKAWQKTWQSLEGWTYKLWTDEDLKSFRLINQRLFDEEKNYGARADILRIEILNRFGGLYVDTDFECLNLEAFDILNSCYDFYCGIIPIDCKALLLNNAIIASVPGHPILEGIIDNLQSIYDEVEQGKTGQVIIRKGPGLLSRMFVKYANKGYRDIALPPSFVYPLGVYQIKKLNWSKELKNERFFDDIKAKVIKPETIAIHWWDGSWIAPEATAKD